MALLPTQVQFNPDDPMPATKFNGLAGATSELSEAFSAEHRADGRHVGVRFEQALASVRWDVSTNAWRPHGLQRGMTAHVRDGTGPNGYDPLFTITDSDLVDWSKAHLGILAFDLHSLSFPVMEVSGNDLRIREPWRMSPPPPFGAELPNVLTVILFGLRW